MLMHGSLFNNYFEDLSLKALIITKANDTFLDSFFFNLGTIRQLKLIEKQNTFILIVVIF